MRWMTPGLLALTVVVACTGSPPPPPPTPAPTGGPIPMVFDTDLGLDDVMALLFLLTEPSVDLRAVTVAGTGLAHCEAGVRNARGLLALGGRPDVPVACGRTEPLAGDIEFPAEWRDAADRLDGIELPPVAGPTDATAVELLGRVLEEADRPVRVLATGPLTNLAELFSASPEAAADIGDIVIMGGAVDAPGNVTDNRVSEWNVYVDPRAANVVFAAGPPVTLVPLDATREAPVTAFFRDALDDAPSTWATEALAGLLDANGFVFAGDYFFWDPLAAVAMVDETVVTIEPMRLRVLEDDNPLLWGWVRRAEDGPEVRVAASADGVAFESRFLSGLAGAPVDASRPPPDLAIEGDSSRCSYHGPASLPAGPVVIEVHSEPGAPLDAAVVRLLEGRTYQDLLEFVEGLTPGRERPPSWVEIAGFAWTDGSSVGLFRIDLRPGVHAIVCFAQGRPLPIGELLVEG